jgi:FkbM family methyltransferase
MTSAMSTQKDLPSYSLLTRLLLGAYGTVKKSGILERKLPKRLFLGLYFLYKKYIEDPFFNLAHRHPYLFGDGIVLDVGANCGYTALTFASTAAKKIYAFEPDPENVKMLHEIIAAKQLSKKVNVVAAAVGAKDGELKLWRNLGHHADHRIATDSFAQGHDSLAESTITVPVVSIDSFLAKNCPDELVTFIKIDVQGYEPPVCDGLTKTLERFPNISLALEYCPAQINELGFSSTDLLEFFKSRGFTWYIIEKNGSLKPFTQSVVDSSIAHRGYIDLLATRVNIIC